MSARRLRLATALSPYSVAEAARVAEIEQVDLLLLPMPDPGKPEPSDGDLAHSLGDLAESHGMALLYTYLEACGDRVHPAVQLVQADGRAVANYRATHLTTAALGGGLAPGNWLTMARLRNVVLGLLAGADHLAPEVARSLSAMHSQVLIGIIASTEDIELELFRSLVRLRAIENGVPILLATATAVAGADATGSLLEPRLVDGVTIIDLPLVDRPTAMSRRPELYRRLVVTV